MVSTRLQNAFRAVFQGLLAKGYSKTSLVRRFEARGGDGSGLVIVDRHA